MTDQQAAIEDVLNGFVPVGTGHPAARATAEAVRELVAQRAAARLEESATDPAAPLHLHLAGGVVVQPGDVLLLGTAVDITAATADTLRGMVMEQLPALADVVVLSHVTIEGVFRGGGHP